MNPWPVEEEVAEVHLPRPGHADLVGTQKYKQTRRAQHPRARLRPRDRGARRRRRAVQGVPARARRGGPLARVQIASVHAPERERALTPADFADGGQLARALPGRGGDEGDGARDRRRCARPTSRSAACSRCRPSASCRGSARTSPGRSASTGAWRWRSARSRRSRASRSATRFTVAGLPGSQAHDEIFYSERARLLPRDQPRRRPRGRHDDRRAADRARRDEAAADAHQAAALGRHRDARAGAGAARAHRLLHGPRRRRRRRGDGRARARRRLPAQVRRRPHRRRARGRPRLRGADRMATTGRSS